jgi:hypothetical protein
MIPSMVSASEPLLPTYLAVCSRLFYPCFVHVPGPAGTCVCRVLLHVLVHLSLFIYGAGCALHSSTRYLGRGSMIRYRVLAILSWLSQLRSRHGATAELAVNQLLRLVPSSLQGEAVILFLLRWIPVLNVS